MVTARPFEDQALGSQAVFRALLDAMARPGRIVAPAVPLDVDVSPATPIAFALALTLFDADTPVWTDSDDRTLLENLRFHCGAPIVETPGACAFALLTDACSLARLAEFEPGTPDYPDRSATLIVQVLALGEGERFMLDGPGILGGGGLAVRGLVPGFETLWQANRRLWPCGVDLVLVARDRLAALPRTTRVEKG